MHSFRSVHQPHSFPSVSGSLSEDAPPPSRSMAVGQAGFSARHAHNMALARSLPVSVPVWGCRGTRAAQGDSSSGERVSTYHLTDGQSCSLLAGIKMRMCMMPQWL